VCRINDPGHTCDEYLILLSKSGTTEDGVGVSGNDLHVLAALSKRSPTLVGNEK
jgi:hypothetical protein